MSLEDDDPRHSDPVHGNGDLAGAKFHIFKIVNGKYETVAVVELTGARPQMRPRPFFCM